MAIELWLFAGNLGMDAAALHRGGVGVAQIVKLNTGQGVLGHQPLPFICDTAGLDWRAVGLRKDEAIRRKLQFES
jgi:hypothetical protein